MGLRLCCYVNASNVDVLTAAYTRPVLRTPRRQVLVYMISGLAHDLRPTGGRAEHTVQRPGRVLEVLIPPSFRRDLLGI